MSIFIGMPNLDIQDAAILVYPDHISFESARREGVGLSVYLTVDEMIDLGQTLVARVSETGAERRRIRTVVADSWDHCTDGILGILTEELEDKLPDEGMDSWLELAASITRYVRSTIAAPDSAFGQDHLS